MSKVLAAKQIAGSWVVWHDDPVRVSPLWLTAKDEMDAVKLADAELAKPVPVEPVDDSVTITLTKAEYDELGSLVKLGVDASGKVTVAPKVVK